MTDSTLTYRRGTPDDAQQINELLNESELSWPGPAATPYVAVNPEGRVVGVYFKCVCLHAEPFCATPGAGVSVTKLADIMREDIQLMANELDASITVYAGVQNDPSALAAAEKNGLINTGLLLHQIVIQPVQVHAIAEQVIAAPHRGRVVAWPGISDVPKE